ncbi:MAG: recombinase family protein [Firmicutes bacterium]|nr:recombinase family protein [Bacillota bacterium]
MRAWLYYRLSRDEDEELNSLTNQKKILVDYAEEKGFEIVGESFDDNVSGMHFDREGIEKIYDVVDEGKIDAIIVKDLSRLGRHRTQTAVFIDYLARKNVRVLSVTENIDTTNENDDLIIGFKGILNDFYAKDISRKVRAGFRQKQKEGIVMIPPMGYFKDKNTGEIVIVEEAAEIVHQIFNWYVGGYGLKAISKMLNEKGMKTPAYYQHKLLNKRQGNNKPEITFRYLWENNAVKRILQNEFYTGTLVNHKYELSKINKTRKTVPVEERFRHENAVPAIISKEIWNRAQFLLEDKVKRNVRASSGKPFKRYTGLLKCDDCGCSFVSKNRYRKDKPVRIEYNCNGYHRYGKEHCTAHRIDEATLDEFIYDELVMIKSQAERNWRCIESDIKKWLSQKNNVEKHIQELEYRIKNIDEEIEKILMERINDKENRKIYNAMIVKRREEKDECFSRVGKIKDIDDTIQKRKTEFSQNIHMIDEIIKDNGINDTHLRMLVEQICIKETTNGLHISIDLKARFATHFITYDENGIVQDEEFESVVGGMHSENELMEILSYVPKDVMEIY